MPNRNSVLAGQILNSDICVVIVEVRSNTEMALSLI